MKKETIIEIKDLKKEFSGSNALDGVNLEVKTGELFGLLGPNGAGKTTMIKCLTGQMAPTSGFMRVCDVDVNSDPVKVRALTGIIPEQENPPSFLTAEEYLFFVAKLRKIDSVEKTAKHWLRFLDYDDQRNVLCKDLSRGTRQKLMFSQAFMHDPKLAFIDEPIINLDPISQKKVKDFLKARVKKGYSIFLSTHVLEIAQEICTSIGIIDRGKIIYQGKPKELKSKKLEHFFIKLVH